MSKLLLIDGNSILNRAFHGLPLLTTKEGVFTNAVLGFINIMMKTVDEEKPEKILVAFDVKAPTFRHKQFEGYKGTRKPMADELRSQVPLIKEVLDAMNITRVEMPGYEADDILGTMSRIGEKAGYEVTVFTGDRDLLQVATETIKVRIPKSGKGQTWVEDYYSKDVVEKYGVDPITFIDMKGLMGDSSDNIPGVPKVGEKTASTLLVTYGSMDGLYEHIDELKPSKTKENLIEFKDQAYLSKNLATIKLDVPMEISIEDVNTPDMFNPNSYELFKKLEFKALLSRFNDADMLEEFTIDYEVVDDFDRFYEIIGMAKKQKYVGVSAIDGDGELIGVSVSFDDKTYLVQAINFLNDSIIGDALVELSDKTMLCFDDLKKALLYFKFNALSKTFSMDIAAYLLNPIKQDYSNISVAMDYLKVALKDRKTCFGKDEISLMSFIEKEKCEYMAGLSLVPYKVYEMLISELKVKGMKELYENIEHPLTFALSDMEKVGIKVDTEALTSYGEGLKVRIDELTSSIYELAGEEFNINSTKKLGEILFEKLGLKSGKKTKTGYSTSVEVLEKIKGEHDIVPLILEYRQLTKLNSTYVEGMSVYIREDGRIHSNFNQTVTATGRISSTEPNLQNIPTRTELGRQLRKIFVPKEGYVFLDADYSQVELRVLAHLSGDETLINAYKTNSDIHAITASEVFGVPIEEVTSLLRRRAKAVNFGIVYGISSFGLGEDLDISRKEAENYIAKYFETYPDVKKYIDGCVDEAKQNGYSNTLYGRIRPIPELSSSNFMTRSFGERVAMNSPIQGTAADIIKIAMINVSKELKAKNLESRIVLQIHDELLVETKESEFDVVKEILVNEMQKAADLSVPLLVDVAAGGNWYEAK